MVYFQSSTTSEGGINLEARSCHRLSEDKDSYFRDGRRKIGKTVWAGW